MAPRRAGLESNVEIIVLADRHVHELLGYAECAGVMREALAELARGSVRASLASADSKRRWLAEIDAWLATPPPSA